MTKRSLERRMTTGEVEVRERNGKATIEGHAAVFNRLSDDLGGFVEQVRAGAFTKTIKESDVRALWNHDENYVLGRNRSGTLELAQDDSGLYYRISPPDTTYARDLMAVMERGDVDRSSFAFRKITDEWGTTDKDYPLRSLIEVQLVDVSPVTYPAYPDADSGVGRSALAEIARRSSHSVDELASDPDLLLKVIRGEDTQPTEEPGATTPPVNRWLRRAELMRAMEERLRK